MYCRAWHVLLPGILDLPAHLCCTASICCALPACLYVSHGRRACVYMCVLVCVVCLSGSLSFCVIFFCCVWLLPLYIQTIILCVCGMATCYICSVFFAMPGGRRRVLCHVTWHETIWLPPNSMLFCSVVCYPTIGIILLWLCLLFWTIATANSMACGNICCLLRANLACSVSAFCSASLSLCWKPMLYMYSSVSSLCLLSLQEGKRWQSSQAGRKDGSSALSLSSMSTCCGWRKH